MEVGLSAILRGVTFGGSTYAAVGSASGQPVVFTSSDSAQSWTKNTTSTAVQGMANLADVAFGNGVFVAVGDLLQAGVRRAAILTSSTPGGEWQVWTTPDFIGELFDVTFGNGRFIAVGQGTGSAGGPQHLAVVSTDNGQTWMPYFPDLPGTGAFEGVAFKNNVFVAAGSVVAFSSDGTSWTQATINAPNESFRGVAATSDEFQILAVGNFRGADETTPYSYFFSSPNGQSFAIAGSSFGLHFHSGSWANDRFVVAGDGGTIISYVTTPPPVQPPLFPTGVFTQKEKFEIGQAASFQIVTQFSGGGAPASYTASGLPPGLTLNPTTGVISGTPTQGGTFVLQLTATNSGGTGSGSLKILVLLGGLVTVDLIPGPDTYVRSSRRAVEISSATTLEPLSPTTAEPSSPAAAGIWSASMAPA